MFTLIAPPLKKSKAEKWASPEDSLEKGVFSKRISQPGSRTRAAATHLFESRTLFVVGTFNFNMQPETSKKKRHEWFFMPVGEVVTAPPKRLIMEVEAYLSSKVSVVSRNVAYPGIDVVVDQDGNLVGNEVMLLLRTAARYLLADRPIVINQQQQLMVELHETLRRVGFERSDVLFFDCFFSCKLGRNSVAQTIYRSYSTAFDSGSIMLADALKDCNVKKLGYFLLPNCFDLAKKTIFEAMGFSEDDYGDGLAFNMLNEKNCVLGLFNDFFTYAKDMTDMNPGTFQVDCERKKLFSLPEGHNYAGESYHPVLLIRHSIHLLNFGTLPFNQLTDPDITWGDLYSEHLVALIYAILTEYFISGGTDVLTGARCLYFIIEYFLIYS